jgi:hypothetical protein
VDTRTIDHPSKGMMTMTAMMTSLPTEAPGFDRKFVLFPETNPGAVFANDVALLMGFVMQLPGEKSAKKVMELRSAADIAVSQFLDTDRKAMEAGLLTRQSTSAQMFVHLGYLLMCRLETLQEAHPTAVPDSLFMKARMAFTKLCAGLDASAFDDF